MLHPVPEERTRPSGINSANHRLRNANNGSVGCLKPKDSSTKGRDTAPTEIELSALVDTLHSFYASTENIFKRVAVELDGQLVRGDA